MRQTQTRFPYVRRSHHSAQPQKQYRWHRLHQPILRRHHKAVQPCLTSKRIEFDTVKIWIIERFPHAEELDSVSVAKPVLNNVAWIITILDFCNVCQAEKIIPLEIPLHVDFCSANDKLIHFRRTSS